MIAAVVVTLAIAGCAFAVVRDVKTSEGPSVAAVQHALDDLPLPPGAVLTREEDTPPTFEDTALVERTYRLTNSAPGAQLRSLLSAAGYRIDDLRTNSSAPPTSALWSTYASATAGDVNVSPPHKPLRSIEVRWTGAILVLTLTGSDLD